MCKFFLSQLKLLLCNYELQYISENKEMPKITLNHSCGHYCRKERRGNGKEEEKPFGGY